MKRQAIILIISKISLDIKTSFQLPIVINFNRVMRRGNSALLSEFAFEPVFRYVVLLHREAKPVIVLFSEYLNRLINIKIVEKIAHGLIPDDFFRDVFL